MRPSRRDVLRGLAGVGLAAGLVPHRDPASAGKSRNRGKKPKPNQYGCLSYGKACKRAGQCCSGICDGKKGRKKCRAHDAGTCEQGGLDYCASINGQQTLCNNAGLCACMRTTGDSNACVSLLSPSECADCKTDADCEALGFAPGSVCAPYSSGICAGICDTGMACLVPCGTEVPEA
jgi:hypothetical protein